MIIPDENIPRAQRELLEQWRIRVRQVGVDVGRRGMKDEKIIPLLLRQRRPTFFTRDEDFYDPRMRHGKYGVVHLAVDKYETAIFVRRLLRHPHCDTHAKRMGAVIRVSRAGLSFWCPRAGREKHVDWGEPR